MVETKMPQVNIKISRKNTYPSKTVTLFYACECPALKKKMVPERERQKLENRGNRIQYFHF